MKKLLALLVLSAFALAACQSSDGDTIKIGFIGPLTGDASPYGIDPLNGVRLKVEEINAAGGVDGSMIELVVEDGRCTGADAASAAQKLINIDNVVAIIGGQCSGETLAAAPISEAAGIVQISSLSSSPDVSRAGDFIFRNYPNDALKTKAMAAYFTEMGYSKVATITENTDFSVAFHNSLENDVGDGVIVFRELVEPNTKDFRSIITRLKDIDFDIFFANGQTSATIAAMMQQLREQGFEQPAISHDVGQDKTLIEIAGEAVEEFMAVNIPAVSEESEFGAKIHEKFGGAQAAMAFAASGYDAMGVLAEAIDSVGTTGTAIRDYFYNLDAYDGVVGTFSFDENGDVVGIPYVLWQVQDGVYVKVKDIPVN